MSNTFFESREAVHQAREALRRGDHSSARRLAEKAARLAPDSEDPWLILAAISSPELSLEYVRKALDANSESARAHRAMQWAMQRLQQVPGAVEGEPVLAGITRQTKTRTRQGTGENKRGFMLPALLLTLGCIAVAFAAWSALSNPALAAIVSLRGPAQPLPTEHPQSWAQAELPKPDYTPTVPAPTRAPTKTPTPLPTEAPALEPTPTGELSVTAEVISPPEAGMTAVIVDPAGIAPTAEIVRAADATSTPETVPFTDGMQAVIVEDTPTSQYAPPPASPLEQPLSIAAAVYGERWIDVDLSQQRVYAYEGDTLMNSFVASTGTWQTPTVTGTYKVWIKLRSTTMTGPGYYLPNVPYTMYFYKGYGLHGTYWHNNFGTPMSHGCVNLTIPDSQWLYNFASVGTTVNVHY